MRCHRCKRAITSGPDADKRIECRLLEGQEVLFGINMPGGKLADARGQLVWAKHGKCYWIDAKAAERAGPAPAASEAG